MLALAPIGLIQSNDILQHRMLLSACIVESRRLDLSLVLQELLGFLYIRSGWDILLHRSRAPTNGVVGCEI
ncbi:hypothetical protein LOK49_LG14G01305 [Camellia lanceoleosa]|uniref:Uncharacterized protein n=1 Tax=Camellia lanceoleosa TaxID=1840588 RepID=A0ACC0FBP7_9ERIC|nr:hypothetical protein LOK49_LG14G01305 [Camellia lanceoleosa]